MKRTVNFYHRLCISLQPAWWNATVSPFPLIFISAAFPKNIWGNAVPPRSLRLYHWHIRVMGLKVPKFVSYSRFPSTRQSVFSGFVHFGRNSQWYLPLVHSSPLLKESLAVCIPSPRILLTRLLAHNGRSPSSISKGVRRFKMSVVCVHQMTTLLRKHLLLGRELYFLLIKGVYLI